MLRHPENGTHRLCVAVTAAGSGIAQTALDGLRACTFPIRVVGFERTGHAMGLFECDVAHRLPSASDPAYSEKLVSICREEGVELLIPGSDAELLKIAEAAAELEEQGCRVLTASPECIRICQDKQALHDFLVEHDAPFFHSLIARDVALNPDSMQYPAILKPRWGSGSVGLQILTAALDWDSIKQHNSMDYLEKCIVQPLGRPSAWTDETWQRVLDTRRLDRQDQLAIQVFFAESGEVIGRMSWLVSLKSGVVMGIETIDEPEIWRAVKPVERAVSSLGIRGPLNIQGIWAGENTRFFELNPRFSGSTGVRALLGYREVEAAARYFGLNEPVETVKKLFTASNQWVGLRQMSERVVPEAWVQTFEKTGSLSYPRPLQRVLVVGGSGFLGQEVIHELLRNYPGAEIIVPVRHRTPMESQWKDHPEWERLRLVEWEQLEAASPSIMADALVHLAAVRPPTLQPDSSLFVENLRLTQLAISAARRLSIPLFIFASSHAVYEGAIPPWTEETSLQPQSAYAYAKVASEELVRQLPEHSIRYAILRLGSLYGMSTRIQWERVIHRFASSAARGQALTVHDGGHQMIELLHVRDGASAVRSLLQGSDTSWDQTYNITSGTPTEILQLAELCCEIATDAKGLTIPIEMTRGGEPTQPKSWGSSNQLARDLLDWSPQVLLRAGIEEVMLHIWEEEGSSEG